jgi:hypothetical protein
MVVCDVVSRFKEKVWLHLVFEDKALYADLLAQRDTGAAAITERYRPSAHDLKKQFADYPEQWCITDPDAADHEAFDRESREIFRRILDRVRVENQERYSRCWKMTSPSEPRATVVLLRNTWWVTQKPLTHATFRLT